MKAVVKRPAAKIRFVSQTRPNERRKPASRRSIRSTYSYDHLASWFEIALNNMARGLSMFDDQQRLIVCNGLYREIYDLPEHLTKPGTRFSEIIRYHASREGRALTKQEVASQRRWIASHVKALEQGKSFSHTQLMSDGRSILVSNQPLPHGGWVDLQEDITERRQAEEKIDWLARHDTLTKLPNRFHFREQLDRALKANSKIAVHWIDLDHYKAINDSLGHPVGDALLESVAERLKSAVRASDIIARLGGDEFAVVQQNVSSAARATSFAKRLLSVIKAPHQLLGNTVAVTASIGIALSPKHGTDAGALLKNADVALYATKAAGRGSFSIYDGQLAAADLTTASQRSELEVALSSGQLELYYQPIVDLKLRSVTSFEALMRWRHPTRGLVPPDDFIPLAERSGLIVQMGAWAIEKACRDAMGWPSHIKVNVNLSPRQFETAGLYATTRNALKATGLDPRRLEFEITESTLLQDDAKTHNILHKLKRLGVRIALDDFGTAYASLSYLRSFPFDKIKIDRSFIHDLTVGRRDDCLAIIDAVVGLAKQMKMTTVAEGIETAEQLDTISVAGCGEVQGFFFSRPVPADQVMAVIEHCDKLI